MREGVVNWVKNVSDNGFTPVLLQAGSKIKADFFFTKIHKNMSGSKNEANFSSIANLNDQLFKVSEG